MYLLQISILCTLLLKNIMLYIYFDHTSIYYSAYLITPCWWDFSHFEAIRTSPRWWRIPTRRQLQGYYNSTSNALMMENPHSEAITGYSNTTFIHTLHRWEIPTWRVATIFYTAVSESATGWDFSHLVFHSAVSKPTTRWVSQLGFHSVASEPTTRWDLPT